MHPEIYTSRRKKIIESLNKNELMILFANDDASLSNRFMQNSHFFYFTGLDTPEAVLVCGHINENPVDMIFIQKNIPERVVWDGMKTTPEQATEISGIQKINFLDDFESIISGFIYSADKVYINCGLQSLQKPLTKTLFFIQKIRERIPHIIFRDCNDLVRPLRQIKDDFEVECLTKAIELTWNGIKSAWLCVRGGMMEYEVEAMIHYEMEKRGCRDFHFVPIVGAGVNAATLHYCDNNCQIQENDLLLTDVGASFNYYSADITRTFPVNGQFNERQKAIYAEVLNTQKELIAMLKPGVSLTEMNKKSIELTQDALIRLGLITDKTEYTKYYMHGAGHHLGLDTHDIGARDSILQEGMVITVEPGIYIPEECIGVRIEDDVLITANGHRVLSDMIPKEIEELESFRQKYHVITQADVDNIAVD